MHNIERRERAVTQFPNATYRGWDAAGRFHYIGKGGVRGQLWWARDRNGDLAVLFGRTLRDISEKLTQRK